MNNLYDSYKTGNRTYPSKDKKISALTHMQSKGQLQDQKYANFTMATVMSTAEHLAWRLCEKDKECVDFLTTEYSKLPGSVYNKLIFNHYNSYNSGIDKPINSLVNQFIFQIENFNDDYAEFIQKYTSYSFPSNMPKSNILKIIDIWITVLNYNNETKPYLVYFQNLRNVFSNIPIKSYEDQVREQFKGNPRSGKADPRVIQREYGNALNFIDNQTKDIDNQNIEIWK
jgi:hypothetical protein